MTEKERMLSGKLYCPFKVGDNTWEKSREVLEKFNSMPWHQEKERMQLLREIFGHLEEDAVIVPPFYCDKGTQIYIGKHFYANTGLLILDEADVRIGGPCIYRAQSMHLYRRASDRCGCAQDGSGICEGSDHWK